MKKIFVLDTNVILFDATCIFKFEEHHLVIPIKVIEETDNFKKNLDERGYNARKFARFLDELRALGKLSDGVPLNGEGGTLKVELGFKDLEGLDMSVPDHQILGSALMYSGVPVTLVSKDLNLRIKADAYGIIAADYENSKVEVEGLYTGTAVVEVSEAAVLTAYKDAYLSKELVPEVTDPKPNQCFILRSANNEKQAVLTRYNAQRKEFKVLPEDLKTFEVSPRNAEQRFALDLLRDPEVNLVTLLGKAGTGKTLAAVAAGLHGVLETREYKKVMLLKPTMAADNSNQLGFLPGTMEEKLAPFLSSYYDNIDFIMGIEPEEEPTKDRKPRSPKKTKNKVNGSRKRREDDLMLNDYDDKSAGKVSAAQELIAHGYLEIGSLEHLRGRSLPNLYIIADEIQNCTPSLIKTIITRAGEGTKIVLMGDNSQIDTAYLSAATNGLTYTVDRFKDQEIAGHVTLIKSERSKLAEIAANIM